MPPHGGSEFLTAHSLNGLNISQRVPDKGIILYTHSMVATVRKPRFRRRPNAIARNFQITERDEKVLLIVGRHRIARSTHIVALIRSLDPGASEQQILRRLEGLYHKRYLSRPPVQ